MPPNPSSVPCGDGLSGLTGGGGGGGGGRDFDRGGGGGGGGGGGFGGDGDRGGGGARGPYQREAPSAEDSSRWGGTSESRAGRPKLKLAKRSTKAEASANVPGSGSDPFGGAKARTGPSEYEKKQQAKAKEEALAAKMGDLKTN